MKDRTKAWRGVHWFGGCALAILVGACAVPVDDSAPREVGVSVQALSSSNGLSSNALATNALTRNALTRNALTRNALTRNALTRNALTRNALTLNAMAVNALTRNALTRNALTRNALTRNALTVNALTLNALTRNALASNALTRNALTRNALTRNALIHDALTTSEELRTLLGYMFACAMPAGAEIDLLLDDGGISYGTLSGRDGLAPQWGAEDGSCDAACQQAIGACVADTGDPNAPSISLIDAAQGNDVTGQTVRDELAAVYACAMPAGSTLDLTTGSEPIVLKGELGLAPEWAEGSCDEDCQTLIADCVEGRNTPLMDVLMSDANARMLFKYIYSCAMPPGQDLTLSIPGLPQPYELKGSVGLAPNWGTESCDESCQRWISACVLARTNAYGIPVEISLRGTHSALAAGDEEKQMFPLREGSYYGNLFVETDPLLYACTGPNSNIPSLTKRFCSGPAQPCLLVNQGYCVSPVPQAELCPREFFPSCTPPQLAASCQGVDPQSGAVLDCTGGGQTFPEVITVYLKDPTATLGNTVCQAGETPANASTDCHEGTWAHLFETAPYRHRIPPNRVDRGVAVAATSDGVAFASSALGDVAVDGTTFSAGDAAHPRWGILARYGANGDLRWLKRFNQGYWVWQVVADSADNLIVTVSNTTDEAIQKYSPDGDLLWSVPVDQYPVMNDSALAVGPDGEVAWAVFGTSGQPMTFTVGGSAVSLNNDQIAITKLDASGNLIWTEIDTLESVFMGVAIDGNGNVIHGTGERLVKRAVDGSVLWSVPSRCSVDFWQQDAQWIAITAQDEIVESCNDGQISKFSAAGDVLWSRRYLGGTQLGQLRVDAAGNVYAGGRVVFAYPATGAHLGNFAIAKLDPAGSLLWRMDFADYVPLHQHTFALDVAPGGRIFVGGTLNGSLGMSGVLMTNAFSELGDSHDVFIGSFLDPGTTDSVPPLIRNVPGTGQVDAVDPVEATGPSGAQVWYELPVAVDNYDTAPLSVSCTPAAGSEFHVGTTSVACRATDSHGNATTKTFPVKVEDHAAPVVTIPGTLTVQNPGPVTFVVSATDAVDGNLQVSCVPASGAVFATGTTLVTCTAKDRSGNAAESSFAVRIPNAAPVITVPSKLVREATGPAGAVVTFAASASDVEDGALEPTCTPGSGSMFKLGTTTVQCTVSDSAGAPASAAFEVEVVDTTPPALILPASRSATAATSSGATVTYSASAVDLVDGPVAIDCAPASGSLFKLGTTPVTCSAQDARGKTATASFPVSVSFAWSGLLQPVNSDGSSVFRLGRTVPLKFSLQGASAGITNAVAHVSLSKISNGVLGTAIEGLSTAQASTGNTFRYDGGQYIFNLSTAGLSVGTYQVRIDLHDGVEHTLVISLQ